MKIKALRLAVFIVADFQVGNGLRLRRGGLGIARLLSLGLPLSLLLPLFLACPFFLSLGKGSTRASCHISKSNAYWEKCLVRYGCHYEQAPLSSRPRLGRRRFCSFVRHLFVIPEPSEGSAFAGTTTGLRSPKGLPQSSARSSQVGFSCSINATRLARLQLLISFSRRLAPRDLVCFRDDTDDPGRPHSARPLPAQSTPQPAATSRLPLVLRASYGEGGDTAAQHVAKRSAG